MEFHGARYIHVFVPCPLGWGAASHDTIRLARLAKETGLFPVFEAEHGEVVERLEDPPAACRSRSTCGRSGATRTSSATRRATRRHRAGSRRSPTATSAASGCCDRRGGSHDERSRSRSRSTSAPAWPTRPAAGAPSGPSTSTGCRRATTPARPARTSRRWLYDAEEGGDGYERAWRRIMEDNPFPAMMGRVCYHPCETACNRGQLDEAVGINSVERFLGDEAIKQGWTRRAAGRRRPASACSSSAPGPSGLSAAYHLARLGHDVTIRDAGPHAGRDDALRHPDVPPAARRPRRRGRSASSTLGRRRSS